MGDCTPLRGRHLHCSPPMSGRLHRSRSIAPAMRNLPGRARTPGCQQQFRQPSLAQTTNPDNPGSSPYLARPRWPAPSLGFRLAVECGWIYHIRPCLQKRSGAGHRMLRRQRVGEASPFSSGPLTGPLRKLGGSRLNLKTVICQTCRIFALAPRGPVYAANAALHSMRPLTLLVQAQAK